MFLKNLEDVIQKVQLKKKTLILCGEWNINFLDDSVKSLLQVYNLVSTVTSPIRITKNSTTQMDVIVLNRQVFKFSLSVLDLGYLDHLAQTLNINANRPDRGPQMSRKRQFMEEGIQEFNYLLQKELWQQSFSNSDANSSFNVFMDMILFYYDIAFPLKTVYMSKTRRNKWITQAIRNSCKRMRLLNGFIKQHNLSRDMLDYITRYKKIYKRVIKEAKRNSK
jgi:hypothetical protein